MCCLRKATKSITLCWRWVPAAVQSCPIHSRIGRDWPEPLYYGRSCGNVGRLSSNCPRCATPAEGQDQCGGLDNVASVLSELVEAVDPKKLVAAAALCPIAWVQRLGYLLGRWRAPGSGRCSYTLRQTASARRGALVRAMTTTGVERVGRWKLAINASVQPDRGVLGNVADDEQCFGALGLRKRLCLPQKRRNKTQS